MTHDPNRTSFIEVEATHSWLDPTYHLFKPTIEINGRKERQRWGLHRFELPPGDYAVSVSYPWLFSPECGKNTARFKLEPGQVQHVKYRAGLVRYLAGAITVSEGKSIL